MWQKYKSVLVDFFFKKCPDFFRKYEFCELMQFALLNGIVWMLMSLFYLKHVHFTEQTFDGVLYSILFTVGHLGVFAAGFWLLLQVLRFCGRKFSFISSVFLGTVLIFLLFADIVVYTLYRFHINIPMIGLFCSPAAFELVEFSTVMILLILLIISAIVTGEYFLRKAAAKFKYPWICFCCVIVIAISFGAFNFRHAWAVFNAHSEILLRTDVLPLKYAMTASRLFMRHGYKPVERIGKISGSVMNYPLNKLEFKPMEKRKNIIFIIVDSLRADMIDADIMPNLYSMSKELQCVNFRKNFSGGNCTKSGFFSMFYGIPGNYFDQALRSGVGAAMIDSMLELGYDIGVFSSGTLASPPFNRTVFLNVKDIELKQMAASKIERDRMSVRKCEDFLQKRDGKKPYFALLFLDAVHGSAVPPDFELKFDTFGEREVNYLTLSDTPENKMKILNMAKNSSLFTDQLLQGFFERINVRKLIDEDTVLIVTSDHGNEFCETDMKNWGHNSNFARFQTHTPLLIFGLRPQQEINYLTSGMDLSVTIMQDILGCTNKTEDYSIGKNLFDSAERPYLIFSSYLETAIFYKGNIFVQTVYGVMQKYDIDGKFINAELPPEVIKIFFEIMAKYSK